MRYPSVDNIKDIIRYSILLADFPTQESATIILNDIYNKKGKSFLCFSKPNIPNISQFPHIPNLKNNSPNDFIEKDKDVTKSIDGIKVICNFII